MPLSSDLYRELEDMVGTEYISADPVVLDGYAYQRVGEFDTASERQAFTPRPEAAVLPENTEAVQAIVKWCNRRGVSFKASCTGYGPWNAMTREGAILLDMRRMNRILELDEKNMFIVVEPYVSFGQIQSEAWKRGLNCNIIGAGAQTSFLASHTSMGGCGIQTVSMGYSGRNILGVEWVTPTGEIVRIGSPGNGSGWFSGDGPGPSIRGIIRGCNGASGGLGVFTKCAGKLGPWPGPAELKIEGASPEYEAEIPPLFDYHILEWPTWEKCADGLYRICEAGLPYALHKAGGPGSHGAIVTTTNNEYWERRKAGELLIPKVSMGLVMAAKSAREHTFQVKVLDKILAETGGRICPVGEEPTFRRRDFLHMVKACFVPRLAFRLTGAFTEDGMIGIDSIAHATMGLGMDEAIKDKYAEKGAILADGTYNTWAVMWEAGHLAHFECGHQFDQMDDESVRGVAEMMRDGMDMAEKVPLASHWIAPPKMIGPQCENFHLWMGAIKRTFDPNLKSDPSAYISGEED
jgi:glycolate oxidase